MSHNGDRNRYFGAPWGALLLGPAALVKPLFHERRMLGGACTNAALAAAMALEGMKSFPVRCFRFLFTLTCKVRQKDIAGLHKHECEQSILSTCRCSLCHRVSQQRQ